MSVFFCSLVTFIYKGFTAQVLKVCRSPGCCYRSTSLVSSLKLFNKYFDKMAKKRNNKINFDYLMFLNI